MSDNGNITGLSDAIESNAEIEHKISEIMGNADFSNSAHLKILFELQTMYYKSNRVMLKMLAEAIEYVAEKVGNMPQIKGESLVDKINEICAEIDDNTAAIKKLQEQIENKRL